MSLPHAKVENDSILNHHLCQLNNFKNKCAGSRLSLIIRKLQIQQLLNVYMHNDVNQRPHAP